MAGTHSGVGKTTVATGIMAALTRLGTRVGAAKVGPDYIDPGYHARATGRPSRNLDAWMCGPATIPFVAAKAADGCDLLVVEGVMGLFDGAASPPPGSPAEDPGPGMYGSTAHVARLLGAPVVLVVDASAQSGSVAALVHGFATYDPTVEIAAVVLNRVASDSHEQMLRDALGPSGIPVAGVLRRDDAFRWRDRHLGLVPVIEHGPELAVALDRLAVAVAAGCDLHGIRAIAARARPHPVEPAPTAGRDVPAGRRPRIAVAAGPAFSFNYPDNLEALEAAGAELVPFDPVEDGVLPAGVGGLVAGGGFPEVFAEGLAANRTLLADTARRVGGGLVTWAECGGLLWLATSLDGRPMAGALPCSGTMTDRLTLGYRTARLRVPSPIAPAGSTLRGHEFHYSTVEPPGTSLVLEGRTGSSQGGFAGPTLFASYLHQHLAGAAHLADRFVASCVPS